MEQIDFEDVARVNTFSRAEVMKEKTRELTKFVSAFVQEKDYEHFFKRLDQYDHFAIDWIRGPEIEWEGSRADKKAQTIMRELGERLP